MFLCEEVAESFFYYADFHNLYAVFVFFKIPRPLFSAEWFLDYAVLLSAQPLLYAANGSHFTTEADLGSEAIAGRDGNVDIA